MNMTNARSWFIYVQNKLPDTKISLNKNFYRYNEPTYVNTRHRPCFHNKECRLCYLAYNSMTDIQILVHHQKCITNALHTIKSDN